MNQREYPKAPIMVVGGIIFQDDSVLLAKRGQEPDKGQWSFPGGAVELGETLMEALKREIVEEISIKIEIGGLVRLLDKIIYDQKKRVRYHYIIADYWGRLVSGRPKPASDVSEARFFPLEEIREMEIHAELKETIFLAIGMRRGGMEGLGRLFDKMEKPLPMGP